MLPQRQLLRGAPRFAARLRSPVVQRRLASSTPQAGENAFVRERRAVKEHAAGTTELWRKISLFGVPPPSSWPASTPTPSGTSIGSTGRTCPLLRSAPSTPTRTFAPATSPGAMVTSWNESVNYHNHDKVK